MKERLLVALARPQVLVALLLLIAALGLALSVPRREPPPRAVIDLEVPSPTLREQQVTVVVVDELGLERERSVTLPLPEGDTARLTAVFAELRQLSFEQGVWPAALPVPRLFVSGTTLVVDVRVPEPVGVSVEQESALLRSLGGADQRAQHGAGGVPARRAPDRHAAGARGGGVRARRGALGGAPLRLSRSAQGYMRVSMRGNGMTWRMCCTPVTQARKRSRPMP